MVWESPVWPAARVRHRLARFECNEPSGPTYFVLRRVAWIQSEFSRGNKGGAGDCKGVTSVTHATEKRYRAP
ncbi:hypothetical protein EVAR_74200_1 [Eumeta japonica]|uniref:Uncharacterized protein n=1 Tax=Eumeta variegata TaxID=151549 RepID=A0A4C1SC89_EUMVA|nr:hypothetical protein EVAR_74200_1 [Eumeta japonica]